MRLTSRLSSMLRRARAGRRASASVGSVVPGGRARVPFFEPLEGRTMLSGRGFAAYYFAGTDFAQLAARREDAQINFDWQHASAGDPAVAAGGFGAHYSARVMPKYTETYHFYARSTGGVRVWVNDKLIINDWSVHALKDNKGSIALKGGARYDLRIEYFDTSSASRFELHWASRRQARQVVPSSRLFATPFDTTPPAAPTKLRATYVTDTAYKVMWNGSADESPGGIVYDVYTGRTRMGATTDTSFSRGGRNPGLTYGVSVRAVDWAGNVALSAPLMVTTKPAVAPGDGTGLAARYYDAYDFTRFKLTRTDPQVLFGWPGTPFDDADTAHPFSARWEGSIVSAYEETHTFSLLADGAVKMWVGGRLLIDQPDTGAVREHQANMKPRADQPYSIKIEYQHSAGQAMIAASWASLSTRKQAIPVTQLAPAFEDSSAPTAPGNVRVEATGQNSVSLRWDAAVDDLGIRTYQVYRNGQMIDETSNLNFTDGNLAADTTYAYQIVAVDVAGKASSMSAPLSARTKPVPLVPRSAFSTIGATSFNSSSGVSTSGSILTGLDHGDWVRFGLIDFGNGEGANSLHLKLGASAAGAGGTIEVRLGARDGLLIGSHVVQATGSYDARLTQRVSIDHVTGTHDVYLVFRNRGSVANVESFQFSPQRLLRVMALGDSITDGRGGYNSYRHYLYQDLIDAGYGVDFVGSQTLDNGQSPPDFDFDQNHEGHSGMRADQMAQEVTSWVAAADPDVVLIHMGTNDIWRGDSRASTVGEIEQIIDAIRAVNPSVKIVLAQVIPLVNYEGQIDAYNDELAVMAAARTEPGSPIVVADMHTGWDIDDDTYDGVHPNNTGAAKMADRWFDAIEDVLA